MKKGLLVIAVIISSISFGQGINKKLTELKALGKDKLIEMAVEQISDDKSFSGFNPENFDIIKVYIEDSNLYVVFSMEVLFSPINSSFIYGINVNLINGSKSWSPLSNPKESDRENPRTFYTPGSEREEALKTIYKTGKAPVKTEVTIFDHSEYYEVEEMSMYSALYYKINKADRKIFDEIYEDLAIEEDDSSGMIEIKE